MLSIGRLASCIGKGLFAGAAGTAAMTLSSTIEMKVRGRKGSDAPAQVAGKLLGVSPVGEDEKARFTKLVHWGYGISRGAGRGVIGAIGISGPAAAALHFGMVWGSALVMLPSLEVTPPPNEWGARELGIDAAHHVVYAGATSAAYELLDRNS
jgi:hypothetical protein